MTDLKEMEVPMIDADIERLKTWLGFTLSGGMHYKHEVSREALEECLRAIQTLQARSQSSAPALPVEAIQAAIDALNEDIDGTNEYIANSDYDDNSVFEGFNAERRKHIDSLRALLPEAK